MRGCVGGAFGGCDVDVLVTYNERGLRDRPILPKAAGEYRILALGDSVTLG